MLPSQYFQWKATVAESHHHRLLGESPRLCCVNKIGCVTTHNQRWHEEESSSFNLTILGALYFSKYGMCVPLSASSQFGQRKAQAHCQRCFVCIGEPQFQKLPNRPLQQETPKTLLMDGSSRIRAMAIDRPASQRQLLALCCRRRILSEVLSERNHSPFFPNM